MRALFSPIHRWILRVLGGLYVLCVESFSSALRVAALLLLALFIANSAPTPQEAEPRFYLGFDRNVYPGDAALPILRKTFAFSSYWLSPPPGEKTNTWTGKRELLRSLDFGFLVLYRGPDSRELKTHATAKTKGTRDGEDTVASARAEGFSAGTIVFLDIEEGGRLPDTYHAYLDAWSEALTHAGYRPGAYCSGMPVKEGPRVTITTADDIRSRSASRDITVWAYNDACPPSPGCATPQDPPAPSTSGIAYAQIWQFVRSPRDKETARRCRGYAKDGNCYAAFDAAHRFHLDVNSATSPDPSGGAK
jgi:glycoside hydrolase-like protein